MTSEQAQPDLMVLRLQAIVAATDELARCLDVDRICRRAVELARKSLGLERCAIFLEDNDFLEGTYGTDMQGETTDEHQQRLPINAVWLERIRALQPLGLRWETVEETRRDWDGEYAQPAGEGWIAFTPIHAAQKLIGLFFNDAAISGSVLDPTQQEFVAAFCSLLGSIIERNRAEATRAEERNLLRTLIDTLPDDIYGKDTEARHTLGNLAHARLVGFAAPEQMIGKTDFDLFPQELAAQYFADDEQILRTGQPLINREEWTVDQTGQRKWVLTTKIPLRNLQGKIVGLVGVTRDITQLKQTQTALEQANAALESRVQERVAELQRTTAALEAEMTERKQAEERLQRERNRLRALIDTVPANVYIKDTESRFVEANLETALQMGGKTPNDLIGKTDFDFFTPELARKYFADEQAILQSGFPMRNIEESNFDQRTQQKSWFLTTKVPILDAQGEMIGLVGVGLDITERKRVQEQIARERDLLRTLIDQIPDYIFIKDAEGRFVNSNAAHNRVAQVKDADALLGKTAFEVFPAHLAAQFEADDHQVVQFGQALINVERTSVDVEGRERAVLTTKVPLCDASGKVTGLVGISRDITERKQAEQALQAKDEAERRFQASLKALYEITIELTQIDALDDFYRRVVELALERLGFDRFGLLLYDVDPTSVVRAYGTNAQETLAAERHLQFEPSLLTGILKRTLDPTQRFALDEHAQLFSNRESIGFGWNAAALLRNGEQSFGWIATDNGVQHQAVSKPLLDILALYAQTVGALLGRKRAEQAFRENEAKLQTFFEVLPVGVAQLNDDGRIVEMNPALERILAISKDGLLNGAYRSRKYTFSDGRPMARSEFPSARVRVEHQAIHDVVVGVVKEDATTVWVSISAAPLPLAKSGVITVTTDITERKQAEKQAFALAAEQQRVKLLRDFITDVSHDLRTPLTIIGTSAALISRITDPVKRAERSQRIEEQVARLSLLLDNFVELAHLEQVASSAQFQPTDLDRLLQTLIERCAPAIARKHHHLDYVRATPSLQVLVDSAALSNAVNQVITNAIDYTPEAGSITVHLYSEGEQAVIEVADTGMGIPPDSLPHIFESFYRVDSARSTESGGAGLGLSMAKKVIELMHGHLDVRSDLGVGSTFRISLPLQDH